MSSIAVVRKHALTMAQARALAERAVDDLAARYGVAAAWCGNRLRFTASGAKGEVRLSPTEIRLEVELGLLLRPLKAKLAERIERRLDQMLAARRHGQSRRHR